MFKAQHNFSIRLYKRRSIHPLSYKANCADYKIFYYLGPVAPQNISLKVINQFARTDSLPLQWSGANKDYNGTYKVIIEWKPPSTYNSSHRDFNWTNGLDEIQTITDLRSGSNYTFHLYLLHMGQRTKLIDTASAYTSKHYELQDFSGNDFAWWFQIYVFKINIDSGEQIRTVVF